jgi:hypothetical protein
VIAHDRRQISTPVCALIAASSDTELVAFAVLHYHVPKDIAVPLFAFALCETRAQNAVQGARQTLPLRYGPM